jgi:hypothetical protein
MVNILLCHLKFLNDVASYTFLNATKQNLDHQITTLRFKSKGEDLDPQKKKKKKKKALPLAKLVKINGIPNT